MTAGSRSVIVFSTIMPSAILLLLTQLTAVATAATAPAWNSLCPSSPSPTHSVQPSVASGYRAQLVATGLTSPRGIQLDTQGNLLVIESGKGLTSLSFKEGTGGCLSEGARKSVITYAGVSHCVDGKRGSVELQKLMLIIVESWHRPLAKWHDTVCFVIGCSVVVGVRSIFPDRRLLEQNSRDGNEHGRSYHKDFTHVPDVGRHAPCEQGQHVKHRSCCRAALVRSQPDSRFQPEQRPERRL